jgi:hypothetical protein
MTYPARHRFRRTRANHQQWLVTAVVIAGVLVSTGVIAAAFVGKAPVHDAAPGLGGVAPAPAPEVAAASSPPTTATRVLFGIGAEADTARQTPLVQQAPIKMLSSWYNGPKDLSWLSGWQTGTVPSAYSAGYALHLIVWTGDAEKAVPPTHGDACGRAYPLSAGFLDDMAKLAQIFAGRKDGPPLYVTMFTEFQTYPCVDNAWNPDRATTNYYLALKDSYRAAYSIFHRYAPNAEVSLGWGGWQASFDAPATGGGRSLFGRFADVMRMSDFQSFQAMDSTSNTAAITAMVSVLGSYGPVMLAHYKPDDGSQRVFDADLHTVLTASYLHMLIGKGLFAISLMDKTNVSADPAIFQFVKASVTTYARGWSPTFG